MSHIKVELTFFYYTKNLNIMSKVSVFLKIVATNCYTVNNFSRIKLAYD